MKKALLVMNMPEKCSECRFYRCDGDKCLLHNEDIPEKAYLDEEQLNNCPLRELPEKMEVCAKYPQPGPVPSYRVGWNACLDNILNK